MARAFNLWRLSKVAKLDASKYVLVVSHDVVGAQMAGPGIRYYHLARVLAREFPTILAVPVGSTLRASSDFSVIVYNSGRDANLEDAMRNARVVVAPALWVAQAPSLTEADAPLVVDGYDPYVAETLVLHPDAVVQQQADLTQAYLAGDFFICASERQRDWWLGVLEANGRVNRHTHAEDTSLRRLIDVVPFGLPETPPQHTRQVIKGVWQGIGENDRVILWGGGLWPWLDPITAIRAVAQVWQRRQDIRLIFPGTRHPNPGMAEIPTHLSTARALAAEFALLDKAVFFGDWVAYDDWQNVLLESDLALTLHGNETLESRLAFRSRVFDYIWASLPIIATRGDATSELIAEYGLGVTVAPRDADAVASAILQLLDLPRESWRERFTRAQRALTWECAARPLIEFCRAPRRAPDKIALGARLGNLFYVEQIAQLENECAQLRAERDAAQALVKAYEQRKVVRLLNGIKHAIGQREWSVANLKSALGEFKMLGKFKSLYKHFSFNYHISPDAVIWGYRLFLDREPENWSVVVDKLKSVANTQHLRRVFISSDEFRQKNPGFHVPSLSGNEPPLFIERASDLQELFSHIQHVWERLGKIHPYWSVLASEQFRSSRISTVTRDEFYQSGWDNVSTFFKTLERNGIDSTSLKTCLEYGCGIGRVTYWLAKRFEQVIGYDISRSHLQMAKQYLDEKGVQNVSLQHISSPQEIGNFPKVDVVYSVIVLQHNPPPLIRVIIRELIRALNSGGIAYFQVPTYRVGYRFSLSEYLATEVPKGEMEMHVLPQHEVFEIVSQEQGRLVEVLEDGWCGLRYGERSNTFVVRKE